MFSNAFAKPTVVVPTEFGRVMDRKDPLTKALHSLERAVESNDVVHALRVCTMMKQRELRPTPQFYRLLLQVLAENNLFQEVEAIFEDAIALGVKPDREMWNYLLQVCIVPALYYLLLNYVIHSSPAQAIFLPFQAQLKL